MKLIYIGAGFVGACSSAVMAKFGHDVLVYDVNEKRINIFNTYNRDLIEQELFEQDLGSLVVQNRERISFTADYQTVEKAFDDADAVFICVPTPIGEDGNYKLDIYFEALNSLATGLVKRNNSKQEKRIVVVNKSTVPIEMAEVAEQKLSEAGVTNFGVVSNPEFLVEGQAIHDSFSPDRTVIGALREEDFSVMKQVYQRFYYSSGGSYIEAGPREAAAGKLLANFILLSRLVTSFDVVGRVSESFQGINFEKIRKIVTADKRIGSYGFYNNIYAGGSCLTKDAAALAYQLEKAGSNSQQIKQVLSGNIYQREHFYQRVKNDADFDVKGKKIAVLGLSFKRDTNDVRNSGAVSIAEKLLDDNVDELRVFDPVALDLLKKYWAEKNDKRIIYCKNEKEALRDSNAAFILTDWPQFSTVDQIIISVCQTPYLIADGRRMAQHAYTDLQKRGYDILAVGGPFIKGNK